MVGTTSALPRMGLGMAALGRPGYINLGRENSNSGIGPPEVRTVEVMRDASDAAMRANVRLAAVSGELPWFDCARSYGRSEEFVGNFFRKEGINPSEVYVSSKWGYSYVAGWKVSLDDGEPHEVKDHLSADSLHMTSFRHGILLQLNIKVFVLERNL